MNAKTALIVVLSLALSLASLAHPRIKHFHFEAGASGFVIDAEMYPPQPE
jgi:hypothetical protein